MSAVTEWRGQRYDGVNSTGRLAADADIGEFVETKYKQRWRWLIVERDGEEIGSIVDHPDDGRRIWWAES